MCFGWWDAMHLNSSHSIQPFFSCSLSTLLKSEFTSTWTCGTNTIHYTLHFCIHSSPRFALFYSSLGAGLRMPMAVGDLLNVSWRSYEHIAMILTRKSMQFLSNFSTKRFRSTVDSSVDSAWIFWVFWRFLFWKWVFLESWDGLRSLDLEKIRLFVERSKKLSKFLDFSSTVLVLAIRFYQHRFDFVHLSLRIFEILFEYFDFMRIFWIGQEYGHIGWMDNCFTHEMSKVVKQLNICQLLWPIDF